MQEQLKDLKQVFNKCEDIFDNYRPRAGQKRMCFEFVKQLNEPHETVTICEAGTGTGKSLAYLAAAITYAVNNKKTVIISTGTIALQKQLLKKDIPLLSRLYNKKFSYALAQGRAQYVCLDKLSDAIGKGGTQSFLFSNDSEESQMLEKMHRDYNSGLWNGEKESYSNTIPSEVWATIVSDKHKCQSRFESHRECPFHKARRGMKDKTVILVNHNLLLSDLNLSCGGGVILPSISECVLVIDEAHDLPDIARSASEGVFSIASFTSLAESLVKAAKRHSINESQLRLNDKFNKIFDLTSSCVDSVTSLKAYLQANHDTFFKDNIYVLRAFCENLASFIDNALKDFRRLKKLVNEIINVYKKIIDDGDPLTPNQETIYGDYTFHINWIKTAEYVLFTMLGKDNFDEMAKWIDSKGRGDTYTLSVVPIEARGILQNLLWDYTSDVLLCSATLSSVGSFQLFKSESGYPDHAKVFRVDSPFDYSKSTLCIPVIEVEPGDQEEYTQYLIDNLFEKYITDQAANLVLFSSYWQMNKVFDGVKRKAKKKGFILQQQGNSPKQTMLDKHSKLLKEGKKSVLFGTSSFSFGLDLAGDLLTNLIITKIPFSSPTDIVAIRHSEILKSQGRNPFFELTLPQASRALVQAVGRLIRTEMDSGTVTILDSRLNTKAYGKQIIKSLPPFKRG
ncbi:ATP-dependent DNA helicase DinG [Photobacterium carnosum]|uniref:Helicase ATP-binding domain-containing protein n=1 Tax=Photobacterium carnosum TaxID=2023717 RepID=A0A2N4UW25_9GAMM|nr:MULTISPECIES: ATP-dependent DNA helicase DinG [Photobacterium]MCD9485880.1 ATP-dependent DNA helicase DinG [Photobacterium iliopiscarium]MCD9549392.1 ATP-dependent DNA helicase DinG [Photobacterium carnosum]MCD9553125.1 ATP-dependent DNA helicase DinG [Photobacterium carnosum]MCF2242577.1 ATP-dependent DNA helicase DinG [Photobacterium iliopiscarium]MCF2306580.1 ATP-dependent DNA helicase DinG [Photobacterium carnosum]